MKSLLITVMLLIVVVLIYTQTVSGKNGMKSQIRKVGNRVTASILSTDP